EMQLAAGQERLAALRGQRDAAAESTSQRAARVATLEERHRSATTLLQRIETLVGEMRQRAGQFVEFEAERNAGEAREGLLQLESEQVRARLVEIDELLRNTRQQLDLARD